MAMAMESCETSRFTDIFDEPVDHLLSPIGGYEDKPLLPLIETVKPISGLFYEIEAHVFVASHNCQNPADGLTQDESASIHLYTMQFHGGSSLYVLLNQSLRAENRDELKPWFLFLKLFLTALYKLPSQTKTVWRGVKNVNLSSKYKTGTKFAWWGVSSCTTHIEVLESNAFFGKTGERTLFSIECINGKSVANHSYFKNTEKEVTLMPGSYFEVIGQLNPAPQLYIIQLREITPPVTLVKPPFYKPININPLSIVNKSSIFSQLLSKVTSKATIFEGIFTEMPLETNMKWKQFGITIAGGNGQGSELNQLSFPYGIFIDDNRTIHIADSENHRIVEWKYNATNCQILAGKNGRGNQMNQLDFPTNVIIDEANNSFIISDWANKRIMRLSRQNNTNEQIIISNIECWGLAMDKDGSFYVSDCKKNEVRRWKKEDRYGTIVAGGNGEGNNLNQLKFPTFIFVDEDYSLYISDSQNHRVIKWLRDAKKGIIVAGANSKGHGLAQLNYPLGVIVDHLGQIYVADMGNDRVMRWCKGAREGTIVVGGNGQGKESDQFHYPAGLSFDRQGNLYVVDCWNHRIQKFGIDYNKMNSVN